MPRPWVVSLAIAASACSGDDGHRHPTTPTHITPPIVGSDGAPPADAATSAVAPPATPAPLSETMATPYFQTGDAGAGATAFAAEKWSEARTAFERARASATGEDAARLDVLLGLCNAQLGNWAASAAQLTAARKALPLLTDYLGYHAARALYFSKQGPAALALAREVARDSIVGADAELLVGDVLRGQGDPAKVAAHYQDYLARRPTGPRRSECRFRLAEALLAVAEERAANPPAAEEAQAVALLRQIGIEDPLSSWATKAGDKLTQPPRSAPTPSVPTLSPEVAATITTFTATEHLTRAKVLFDGMRNPESEAAFAAALAVPSITAAERCVAAYHRAQSRFKARDRKGAAPLFDDAATACEAASNVDLHIKSLYQAGRSFAFTGDHEVAVLRYQAAQKVDATHSYADDALLREAEEWASLNNDKQVEATLSALPVKFPKGDNVAEAMWRLGWRAWRAQRLDDAIGWWKKQIDLVPHDDNYFGEGQAQYWLGRAYLAKGKKAQAIASWEAGVRQYPVAYYALQGLNRIREAAPARYTTLVAELAAAPKDEDPAAPVFSFAPRVEWNTPGFHRAMELLRLGLGDPAAAELGKVGLTPPADKKRVDDPAQIEKLWALAYLYDKAGRYGTSHWPTRWHILDYRKAWPAGANRARWLVAYPRAYWELLSRHAATNNVPPAMQIAIVREESAFDPRTESYANAWGLTQMIPPTAKDFAKGTGIAPTRENMFDPEMNVTVGSRFLGHLFKTFDRFTLLVPPGYNAGPTAVKRMLKARGTMAGDEFIEAIVDDQARNYSKRVLGTFFTYSYLYDGTVPELPNAIPTALLPSK